MNAYTNAFALELSDTLSATGENYKTEVVDLGAYGTSCEITKHDSTRTLHITPVAGDLIDLVLYDETGNTIASGTLFPKTATEITPEDLTKLISLCF